MERKPTRMQEDTLRYIKDVKTPFPAAMIPRSIAWYQKDVLNRMVKRGWVESTTDARGVPHYLITADGKAAI